MGSEYNGWVMKMLMQVTRVESGSVLLCLSGYGAIYPEVEKDTFSQVLTGPLVPDVTAHKNKHIHVVFPNPVKNKVLTSCFVKQEV